MPKPDLFNYIAPNDDTAPRHQRIREAHADCEKAIQEFINNDDYLPLQARFQRISLACRLFHDELVAVCPPSADLSAAIHCVRLARMAANEAVAQPDADLDHAVIAKEQLVLARWQACAAVALALPSEMPPLA